MQEEFPKTWVEISSDNNFTTYRMRVPGGWLVAVRDSTNSTTEVAFVADPQHEWVIES